MLKGRVHGLNVQNTASKRPVSGLTAAKVSYRAVLQVRIPENDQRLSHLRMLPSVAALNAWS